MEAPQHGQDQLFRSPDLTFVLDPPARILKFDWNCSGVREDIELTLHDLPVQYVLHRCQGCGAVLWFEKNITAKINRPVVYDQYGRQL